MQSSLALYMGLLLSIYLNRFTPKEISPLKPIYSHIILGLSLVLLIPGLLIHILSYKSLTQQGRLLYEFNNGDYKLTLAELDQIEDDFPNLTETAMPIKAMKARYFYLNGLKDKAHKYALLGSKDNPQIFFGENIKAQFYMQEQKQDSAYYYSRRAFYNLPNNMPHYNVYMNSLVFRRDIEEINKTFNYVLSLSGNTKTIWTIYLSSLAQTTSLGDPFSMSKASEGFALYPEDNQIFALYRMMTYGQKRSIQAAELSKKGMELYNNLNFEAAFELLNQAFDLDPLEYTYAIQTGFSLYENSKYEQAIPYFKIALNSKRREPKEKAMRYMALSLYKMQMQNEACAAFSKLINTYPKRMYQQEFNKYCRN